MILQWVDWISIIAFFILSLVIGVSVTRRAGSNTAEFFVSNRNMPWWLLGVSMVATTFSADTPNLVTDLVRQHGVAGNWLWWAFLPTGMVTVFIYARLWRRSGVMTDLEFYEIRYSGKPAAFLRGFRALYLGVLFNVIVMASVLLAAIKIGGVLFGLSPLAVVLISSTLVTFYSILGGLEGVLLTDFFQFIVAMFGAIAAAVTVLRLPQVGGLSNLLSHAAVHGRLSILPDFSDSSLVMTVFIIPLAVQWWSVWYPGAEPGGGGYVAQRMLAAKNERHAIGATFFFNIAHYAMRPWPWIIVALASIIVFPDLASLRQAFPHIPADVVKHDMAYPAMLTFLPAGLLGIVTASLIAAFMSTIATHLNWGASYIVNDFYKRFMCRNPTERRLVLIGRLSILGLMILSACLALLLNNALQAFHIMLQIGAGTGLLFILRWFWWRINAASEIAAMVISFLVAVYFQFIHTALGFQEMIEWQKLVIGVGITTLGWISVTLLTRPTDDNTLVKFYHLTHPGGPGWRRITEKLPQTGTGTVGSRERWDVPSNILNVLWGLILIYSLLFSIGFWLYGNSAPAVATSITAAIAGLLLIARRKSILS